MKNDFYFSHDYNTRSDYKIKRILAKHGMKGYGIFWSLIEDLYNNANAMPTQYDCIAHDLHTQSDVIKSIINDFGLFTIEGEIFSSESVERRLIQRNEKSAKARESALIKWQKSERNANAMRTQSECNANKGKERKGKIKNSISKKEILQKADGEIEDKKAQWSSDFQVYLSGLREKYTELINDPEYIETQERFHPGVDIKLTIEKAFTNFWATEAGWRHKKKSHSQDLDWKATLTKAISQPQNKVFQNGTHRSNFEKVRDLARENGKAIARRIIASESGEPTAEPLPFLP